MFCKNCGKKIDESKFCIYCGSPVDNIEVVKTEVVNEKKNKMSKKYRVWEIFALIGYVLGIITFTTSFFVPGLFFFYSILGVVFSTLGRKSYKNYERAENGIKLSIASIVVSGIIIVINNSLFYTLLFLLLLIV